MTKKSKKESAKSQRAASVHFRRGVALFLSVSQMLIGSPAYAAEIPKTALLNPPGIQVEFKIPEKLGTLDEHHSPACSEETPKGSCRSKTVIYIQDAHDSFEAQENIAKLIHLLVAKYGVKTVLEEGYEGPVPTDNYFGKIQDPKIRKKVAYFLMDKLRLGGAEYAHITRFNSVDSRQSSVVSLKNKKDSLPEPLKQNKGSDFYSRPKTDDSQLDFNLVGADSLLLHRENIERFQASEKNRDATQADLQSMDTEIRKMTQRYFSRELKEWITLKEKLDRKEMDLLDYLRRTQSLFLKGVGFEAFRSAYPNITLLLSAAETKDKNLLSQLKTSVNYKTLFQEVNKLEDDYADSHLTVQQETSNLSRPVSIVPQRYRFLFRYYKLIRLLMRLNAIEVTEEEYAAVKETLKEADTAQIAEFIARESGYSVVVSRLWEQNIQNAIQFYEIARERDGSIQSRLEEYAASADAAPIILVYGGFHKGRVKELLEQNGLSYAVISPRITSVSARHQSYYRQLMRMGYNNMSLPNLAAIATTPPRALNLAALSAKSEVRLRDQLTVLARIAQKDSSKSLEAAVGTMDLAWKQYSKTARAAKRSEMRVSLLPTRAVGETSADGSGTLRSEVRTGIESYLADVRAALGEAPGLENQPLTVEVQKKLAEAYTALLRGLYPADQGKVFMVFPALKADLFLSLEFPGLYLNRSTDDYGEGVSILSKLKDMPSSSIMSTLIRNFRFTRVEANPLDLSHYEVLKDREASKIEGRAVFVMKGFRREFESWGKDARFVNQVLKDLREGDEILILDRDDLAFAVEQGWLSANEGARQTLFPSQGKSGDENPLELSYGSSQGQNIQLPNAAAVIAVPKGGVIAMTNRAEGATAASKALPASETTLSWNEPWIMLPGQLARDVSLVDLAEKQRANPIQFTLDPRVQPIANELKKLMAAVHAQLPDVNAILNDARILMPSYLTETAHDHQNMINLSGPLRATVFLPELFQEQILVLLSQSPEKVLTLLESLQGFMVHEYGHIVDANGGLLQTDREGQKKKRVLLSKKYGLTKKDKSVIFEVQGDLRAESYRHHFLDRFNAAGSYGEDHYRNLQPESIHGEWRHDLIYMAAWTVDLERNGPANRSQSLAARVHAAKNLSPEQIEFYADFVSYFRGYFESLRYEPNWLDKLADKGGVLPVVRDRATGIPIEIARSEMRSTAEDLQSELTALGVEYQSRRSEIIANGKDQDYQKAQKNAQLINEVAVKIFNLGLEAIPAVKELAVIALADQEKVPPVALGRILKRKSSDDGGGAFIRDATEIVFGKAWEVIDVQEVDSIPDTKSEDEQAAKLVERAIEFIGEQWIGGSEILREKRREQHRSFVRTAVGLKREYETGRAEIWSKESLSVDEKMMRHAEIADEIIRKLYGFIQQLYDDQSRQLALVTYGGQGRKEMHLSSDSEGRVIIKNEMDAIEAGRFFRNATEWIFGKGSRWLLMLDRDPIRMSVEPNALLELQQRQIVQATELLDMRIVAGNLEISESFKQSFEQQLFDHGLELTHGLIDVWNSRYRQAGFVQGLYEREPDVKDGTGGLRTMHYVRWIAQTYTQKKAGYWEELIQRKLLKKKELKQALRSYEFINQVRGELGRVKQSGDGSNRLTLDVQSTVAYALGYKDSVLGGTAADQMMRDYDAHALALFQVSYKVIRRISESENMRPVQEVLVDGDLYQGDVKLDARRATRKGYIFQLSRGFRELKEPKTFLVPAVGDHGLPQRKISPESVMPLFLYAVEHQLKFSGQLLDALEKAAPRFRNKFVKDKKFQAASQSYFKSLLAAPHQTAYVLERMYLLGILPALLPGFKETGYRPRLEMDYRTTLDWYALQSVDALDKFMLGQLSELEGSELSETAKNFFGEISRRPALLRRIRLALLLQKFDDVSLKTVMKQLKLNKKTAASVEWLRTHTDDLGELIRSDAFWQSDILPAYVEKEIGPNTESWSFFMGASLARLYALRPEQFWLYLEAVEPAFRPEARLGQPAELAARLAHERGTVSKLMQMFFGGPRDDKNTVVLVEPLNEKREGNAKVTVYHRQTGDSPGWLEKIAGVLAANGLLIQSESVGDILGENVIIDRFIVSLLPTQLLPGQKKDFSKVWRAMERQLNENVRDALERDIPVSRIFDNKKGLAPPYVSRLPKTLLNRPTVVSFDEGIRMGNLPQRSAGLTTLRVETADRPMLLYVLTKIIAAHGFNIHAGSTMDTEGYDDRIGRQAVDTFILSDKGSKLTLSQKADLLGDLHFWLNHENIDLTQLDRHRELLIYKDKIETYLSQMREKTALRIGYVGDIHGDFERFNQIMKQLERQGIQKIIFIGDLIDHGSQGKEVLQAVRQLMEQGKAVALMGNHELMFIESILATGTSYSRRFDLWLSSGGWAFLREFFGDSIQGVDITAEGSQKIKFGEEDFFIVMTAVKKHKELIELAQWMKSHLKLFHEDENMGFSVHARLKIDAQGALLLEEDDSGRGSRRDGREILNNMQADWNRGDPGDELRQSLLDYGLLQSTLLLGDELPTGLLNVPSNHGVLQSLLTSLQSLRVFNGHIEPNKSPQEHIDLSRGSSGVFNSIDYGLRRGMGGYVVSNSEGIRYFLLPPSGADTVDHEEPVYEVNASTVIKQAEDMLAAIEIALHANTQAVKTAQSASVRSELRSSTLGHFGGLGLKQKALNPALNQDYLRKGAFLASALEAETPYALYSENDLTLLVRHGYKATSDWHDRGYEHRLQTAGKIYRRLNDWAAYKHRNSSLKVLTGDYGGFRNHLLGEIISNALKAVEETQRGQGLVAIRFGSIETQDYFEVSDQGNGISEKVWETLGVAKGTERPKGREGVGVGIVRSFNHFLQTETGAAIEVLSRRSGVVRGNRYYFDSVQARVVRLPLDETILRTLSPDFSTSFRFSFFAKRSEMRSVPGRKFESAEALAIDSRMPVWYFLKAFGFDPQGARIKTEPSSQEWGRVELSSDPQARKNARQSALRVMISEKFIGLKMLSPVIREILEHPETENLQNFYLLTHQGLPAALVWPLPGSKTTFYYPLLSRENGDFFRTAPEKAGLTKSLENDISRYVQGHHPGLVFRVLENPYYDDSPFAHPAIHSALDADRGLSFPSMYVPGEASTETFFSVFDQIDFSGKTVVEIGAGNGRLLVAAAQQGASEAIGYEMAELGIQNTLAWAALNDTPNVRAVLDAADADYAPAAIYLFNSPNIEESQPAVGSFGSQTYEQARLSNLSIFREDFVQVMKKVARSMPAESFLYLRVGTTRENLESYLEGTGLILRDVMASPLMPGKQQGFIYKLARSEVRMQDGPMNNAQLRAYIKKFFAGQGRKAFLALNRNELYASLKNPKYLSFPLKPRGSIPQETAAFKRWIEDYFHPFSKFHQDFINHMPEQLVRQIFSRKIFTAEREAGLRVFLKKLSLKETLSPEEKLFLASVDFESTLMEQGVQLAAVHDFSSGRGVDQGAMVYRVTLQKGKQKLSFFLKGFGIGMKGRKGKEEQAAEKYDSFFFQFAALLGFPSAVSLYVADQNDPALEGFTLMEEIKGIDTNQLFYRRGLRFSLKDKYYDQRDFIVEKLARLSAVLDLLRKTDRRLIQNEKPQYSANFKANIESGNVVGENAIYSLDHQHLFASNQYNINDIRIKGNSEIGILTAVPPEDRERLTALFKRAYLDQRQRMHVRSDELQTFVSQFFGSNSHEAQIFSEALNEDPVLVLQAQLDALDEFSRRDSPSPKGAGRSEMRSLPEDLIPLMPPLETVLLQPLDALGRETVLHLNRAAVVDQGSQSSFAEYFAAGSRNLAALQEALTKNYERLTNERSLYIDLPEPFVLGGRRWIRLQLKGIIFDSRQEIVPHSEETYSAGGFGEHAKGFVDRRIDVFPDGRIENIGDFPSPDGAMTLEKASREFALAASINKNLELSLNNIFSPGAVAYGEFPGLSFKGQPLAFAALGIDDEMVGAVTRSNENSTTVAADVTSVLRFLHLEGYSHPFLHGGNLSSNVARTKWYVHDLDAARLFNPETDTLSFAAAAQVRDFFYLLEKYVFDRYLSNASEGAVSFGFWVSLDMVKAYFPDWMSSVHVWQVLTGSLVSFSSVQIDGGVLEVLEHYLRQLRKPGNAIYLRDIIYPVNLTHPLMAGFEMGAFIQSRLRTKGFKEFVSRSEIRVYRELKILLGTENHKLEFARELRAMAQRLRIAYRQADGEVRSVGPFIDGAAQALDVIAQRVGQPEIDFSTMDPEGRRLPMSVSGFLNDVSAEFFSRGKPEITKNEWLAIIPDYEKKMSRVKRFFEILEVYSNKYYQRPRRAKIRSEPAKVESTVNASDYASSIAPDQSDETVYTELKKILASEEEKRLLALDLRKMAKRLVQNNIRNGMEEWYLHGTAQSLTELAQYVDDSTINFSTWDVGGDTLPMNIFSFLSEVSDAFYTYGESDTSKEEWGEFIPDYESNMPHAVHFFDLMEIYARRTIPPSYRSEVRTKESVQRLASSVEREEKEDVTKTRSEVRSRKRVDPDKNRDQALATEYARMVSFETDAAKQRQAHVNSPRAILLKLRDPAAERKQFEWKFETAVFVRDWIGVQSFGLMGTLREHEVLTSLESQVMAETYPLQAALEGVRLASQTTEDTLVDFLFRVQNNQIVLELRNAESHRMLSDQTTSDFIRLRFNEKGQKLVKQLMSGKPVDAIVKEMKSSRSEMRPVSEAEMGQWADDYRRQKREGVAHKLLGLKVLDPIKDKEGGAAIVDSFERAVREDGLGDFHAKNIEHMRASIAAGGEIDHSVSQDDLEIFRIPLFKSGKTRHFYVFKSGLDVLGHGVTTNLTLAGNAADRIQVGFDLLPSKRRGKFQASELFEWFQAAAAHFGNPRFVVNERSEFGLKNVNAVKGTQLQTLAFWIRRGAYYPPLKSKIDQLLYEMVIDQKKLTPEIHRAEVSAILAETTSEADSREWIFEGPQETGAVVGEVRSEVRASPAEPVTSGTTNPQRGQAMTAEKVLENLPQFQAALNGRDLVTAQRLFESMILRYKGLNAGNDVLQEVAVRILEPVLIPLEKYPSFDADPSRRWLFEKEPYADFVEYCLKQLQSLEGELPLKSLRLVATVMLHRYKIRSTGTFFDWYVLTDLYFSPAGVLFSQSERESLFDKEIARRQTENFRDERIAEIFDDIRDKVLLRKSSIFFPEGIRQILDMQFYHHEARHPKAKVLILEPVGDAALKRLVQWGDVSFDAIRPDSELVRRNGKLTGGIDGHLVELALSDKYDFIVVYVNERFSRDFFERLQQAGKLPKGIIFKSTITDNLDIGAATEYGVQATNVPSRLTAMADFNIALALDILYRKYVDESENVQVAGNFSRWAKDDKNSLISAQMAWYLLMKRVFRLDRMFHEGRSETYLRIGTGPNAAVFHDQLADSGGFGRSTQLGILGIDQQGAGKIIDFALAHEMETLYVLESEWKKITDARKQRWQKLTETVSTIVAGRGGRLVPVIRPVSDDEFIRASHYVLRWPGKDYAFLERIEPSKLVDLTKSVIKDERVWNLPGQDFPFGVVAMGRIGEGVVQRAIALGMAVHIFQRGFTRPDYQQKTQRLQPLIDYFSGKPLTYYEGVAGKSEFLTHAHLINFQMPDNVDSKGWFSPQDFNQFVKKPAGVGPLGLINAARGRNLAADEDAEDAMFELIGNHPQVELRTDVLVNEARDKRHLFENRPNIQSSPHSGAAVAVLREAMDLAALENNLRPMIDGRAPLNPVNRLFKRAEVRSENNGKKILNHGLAFGFQELKAARLEAEKGDRHQFGGQADAASSASDARSEVRTKVSIQRLATSVQSKNTKKDQRFVSLQAIIEKAGPTKIFVDGAAPVISPRRTAKELGRLAKAGAEIVIYNLKNTKSDNKLMGLLQEFQKSSFQPLSGSWSEALAGSENAPDELNLVHYSESEAEARNKAPAWAEKRVIYLAGKSGSAAYGLSQIKALRKAVQAEEIKESLLLQLGIVDQNGFYFVSEAKSTWMRLQLEAESIVAFAQAA